MEPWPEDYVTRSPRLVGLLYPKGAGNLTLSTSQPVPSKFLHEASRYFFDNSGLLKSFLSESCHEELNQVWFFSSMPVTPLIQCFIVNIW